LAQFNLADVSGWRRRAQDDGEAAKWYRKAAEQGHATAKLRLDKMKKNKRCQEINC